VCSWLPKLPGGQVGLIRRPPQMSFASGLRLILLGVRGRTYRTSMLPCARIGDEDRRHKAAPEGSKNSCMHCVAPRPIRVCARRESIADLFIRRGKESIDDVKLLLEFSAEHREHPLSTCSPTNTRTRGVGFTFLVKVPSYPGVPWAKRLWQEFRRPLDNSI
jgi:hypothetical protein